MECSVAPAARVDAATNAVAAGFDGVELHGVNGYLIEQFLNANINTRTDAWGGDASRRNRFALEVARAVVAAIGGDRVGIRLSPHGLASATGTFEGVEPQYAALAGELAAIGIVYLHVMDSSSMNGGPDPRSTYAAMRAVSPRTFSVSGGYDQAKAEAVIAEGRADLVAFGTPFIANPDLVERMQRGIELAKPAPSTFFSASPAGYTDYPAAT